MDGDGTMGLAGAGGLSLPNSADLLIDPSQASRTGKPEGPKKGPRSLKKPANAPKRFKSSFIFFSMAKHREIKEQLAKQGEAAKTTNITKMVSDAWRSMGTEEREKYDAMAREDKARYERERKSFIPAPGASAAKKIRDPNAPKRPMSAFLAFANSRRAEVKAQNPDCSNGEISKILSRMWREAAENVKQKYRDDEAALWAAYKVGMQEWRKKNDGRKKASKQALAALNGKKKRTTKKTKDREDMSTMSDGGFNEQQLSGITGTAVHAGLDPTGNPNQDEMMAASALRGVRGAPGIPLGPNSIQNFGNNPGTVALESNLPHPQQLQHGGGYGGLFGANSMTTYGAGVTSNAAGNAGPTNGFPQEVGGNTNRTLLEMGFPYQQYGGYPLGNPQAMLMAQALRGPAPYHNQLLGLSDQQPSLSQLASLAGAHNNGSPGPQHQVSGANMGIGNLMNDNSAGSINRMGGMDGSLGNSGLSGGDRF